MQGVPWYRELEVPRALCLGDALGSGWSHTGCRTGFLRVHGGTLVNSLELKWVWAKSSWDTLPQGFPGQLSGTKVAWAWSILECFGSMSS